MLLSLYDLIVLVYKKNCLSKQHLFDHLHEKVKGREYSKVENPKLRISPMPRKLLNRHHFWIFMVFFHISNASYHNL